MCNFSVPFQGKADDIVSKAKEQITAAGGNFNIESPMQGSFSISTMLGSVQGSYTVQQAALDIIITDKPMFVSCDKIEKVLNDKLNA